MSRLLWIVIVAMLFGFIGFLIGSAISQYQVRVLFYGPDQAGEFIDFFLIVWPLFFVIGSFLGYWGHKRNLIRRSSGRS